MSDMPSGSTHYRCTFRMGRRQMTVPFSQGPALLSEPTAVDVLDCLISAASGYINASNFEDWASEYGYDSDSRTAERVFRTVSTHTGKLQRFIRDAQAFDDLLYKTERL